MKKVLVVEDSKTMNNIITQYITTEGFNVDQALTFKESKELLQKMKYDLIILDLHLPDGEGFELIANIQSLTTTKVIVLTAISDDELREELFEYGILDYIIKDKNLSYALVEVLKVIHSIKDETLNGSILLIDDSKTICKQIVTILEPRNYSVTTALNATEGLRALNTKEYNLLILDMELPDMHGLKVLQIIRNSKKFASLPILVLSGTATKMVIRDSLKNGASDFLKKPFVFEELILKVDLWIDYFKKRDEINHMNKNLQTMVETEVQKSRKKDHIMFQQSRYIQMGEMIAMIVHQFRQPLSSINSTCQALNLKADLNLLDNSQIKELSTNILRYSAHLNSTIEDFRNFFKTNKHKEITTYDKVLESLLGMIQISLITNHITLIQNLNSKQNLLTYPNELKQVILNLIKNAEDILLEKNIKNPTITIDTNDNILSISDNGGGIPNNIIDKIFDPYFSTKTQKDGTGLGLYMSKIIIEEHCDGELLVENNQDGAVFSIILKGEEKC